MRSRASPGVSHTQAAHSCNLPVFDKARVTPYLLRISCPRNILSGGAECPRNMNDSCPRQPTVRELGLAADRTWAWIVHVRKHSASSFSHRPRQRTVQQRDIGHGHDLVRVHEQAATMFSARQWSRLWKGNGDGHKLSADSPQLRETVRLNQGRDGASLVSASTCRF